MRIVYDCLITESNHHLIESGSIVQPVIHFLTAVSLRFLWGGWVDAVRTQITN